MTSQAMPRGEVGGEGRSCLDKAQEKGRAKEISTTGSQGAQQTLKEYSSDLLGGVLFRIQL